MINKLQIQNFQSHKDSVFNFVPGVNVLTGTSGVGKSAVFRALVLAFQNRPRGTGFIKWGNKQAKISIDITNSRIERIRSSSKNLYVFDGIELNAGHGVPETVENFLSINSINIQHQITPPFLLSSSPGEVAQFFNEIAGLSTIDQSMKNIQSEMRKLNKNLEHYQQRETDLKQELEKYTYLEQAEGEISSIEQQEQRKNRLSNDINRIQTLMISIGWYKERLETQEKLAQAFGDIKAVEKNENRKEEIARRYKALFKLRLNLRSHRKQIKYYDKKADALQRIEGIESREQCRSELQGQKQRLNGILNTIKQMQKRLDRETECMNKYQTELKEKMPAICPLCNQEIRNEKN